MRHLFLAWFKFIFVDLVEVGGVMLGKAIVYYMILKALVFRFIPYLKPKA